MIALPMEIRTVTIGAHPLLLPIGNDDGKISDYHTRNPICWGKMGNWETSVSRRNGMCAWWWWWSKSGIHDVRGARGAPPTSQSQNALMN